MIKPIFSCPEHREMFYELMSRCKKVSNSHLCVMYLLSMTFETSVCAEYLFFDFENDCIRRESIFSPFLGDEFRRILRLAFNLWDGFFGQYGDLYDDPQYYTPYYLFDSPFLPYYFQAIMLATGQGDYQYEQDEDRLDSQDS